MAEATVSSAEEALENQRLGGLQIRVAALCALVQICDGYDINSVGVTVPQLTHAWGLPGPAFTQAFLWSSIGIMVGALSAGPIGDRIGRKPLLLASLTIFGFASLASAMAGSLFFLTVARFFTGLGIGGAMPGAAKLKGDYAPQRWLLPSFGWPSVYIVGGVVPLLMVVALALWLPESPRFLATKGNLSPREAELLRRLGIRPGQSTAAVDVASGNPIKMLFGEGYALQTVLLWIVFFCSLMNLFLFAYWMPEVLHLGGMTPGEAARATSYRDLGAIFAVLYLGALIDKHGPERALAWHYAAGIIFIGAIALLAMPYLLLVVVIFLSGMTIIGSQTGANATAGKLYPARMRTSGIGWALGIGRLGGIAAPVLGGWLLSLGMHPPQIFLSACAFALIAAIATALLVFRGARAEVLTPQEAAQ
jgi:MFS transporter, AAHS family, 4-hydroxybenzoate transporter